ncbi:MAG: hypothetical protein D3923_07510 [Candidatus Electrothrix sp. AR3]|nr:hypothetical protein [Candidatus Electrothrix sp. AR3]
MYLALFSAFALLIIMDFVGFYANQTVRIARRYPISGAYEDICSEHIAGATIINLSKTDRYRQ